MNKPKVAFLIPAYGVIQLEAWQSHINLLSNWSRFCLPGFFTASSCYLHECRNRLLEMWRKADKQEKFDYVFWIDSDMKFDWTQVNFLLEKMTEDDLDMASGLYFNIVDGARVPMAQFYDKDKDSYSTLFVENSSQLKIDGTGFGFVCMRAQVLRKMLGDHGSRLFDKVRWLVRTTSFSNSLRRVVLV